MLPCVRGPVRIVINPAAACDGLLMSRITRPTRSPTTIANREDKNPILSLFFFMSACLPSPGTSHIKAELLHRRLLRIQLSDDFSLVENQNAVA